MCMCVSYDAGLCFCMLCIFYSKVSANTFFFLLEKKKRKT